jgi:hypothetical protein
VSEWTKVDEVAMRVLCAAIQNVGVTDPTQLSEAEYKKDLQAMVKIAFDYAREFCSAK